MAVVMAHGVLFRSGAEGEIRKALINENLLDAVIGLPRKQFVGLVVSTVILIFKKEKTDTSVLFIDTSDFVSGKTPDQLREPDIKKVLSTYEARKTERDYSYLSSLENIQNNNYDLSISRYVEPVNKEEEIDLASLARERQNLTLEIDQIGPDIDKGIEALLIQLKR
jgi:type I restriction enzyme M protein